MRTVESMEAHEQLHETIDAQDALINKQRALIKQLGEALGTINAATYRCSLEINSRGYQWRGESALDFVKSEQDKAIIAYNNWKRERWE